MSKKIERWDFTGAGAPVITGDWVSYSDHCEALAERDRAIEIFEDHLRRGGDARRDQAVRIRELELLIVESLLKKKRAEEQS